VKEYGLEEGRSQDHRTQVVPGIPHGKQGKGDDTQPDQEIEHEQTVEAEQGRPGKPQKRQKGRMFGNQISLFINGVEALFLGSGHGKWEIVGQIQVAVLQKRGGCKSID